MIHIIFGFTKKLSPSSSVWRGAIIQQVGWRSFYFTHRLAFSIKTNDEMEIQSNPLSSWNLKVLRKEADRHHQRIFKKLVRINERRADSDTPSEESKCITDETRDELSILQSKLLQLEELKNALHEVNNTNSNEFNALVPQIISFGLANPTQQNISLRKTKEPKKSEPRKPYHVYRSLDGIEIRVGREAEDNDMLSTDPALRDDNDWWMHVSGLPGSHVVIRNIEDDLPSRCRNTIMDAATLAVIHSKAKTAGGKIHVTLTRCRNVSKPRGAKPGLVQLDGDTRTVTVDIKAERGRLDRLKKE